MKKNLLIIFIIILAAIVSGCSKKEQKTENKADSIAVFIPGVIAGSPTYEMLAEGAGKSSQGSRG